MIRPNQLLMQGKNGLSRDFVK